MTDPAEITVRPPSGTVAVIAGALTGIFHANKSGRFSRNYSLVLVRGKGVSGTGTSRNAQSGAQPCETS